MFNSSISNIPFIKRLILLSLNTKSLYSFVIHNKLYLENYFSFEELISYNLFFDKITNDTFHKLYKNHIDILNNTVFHLEHTVSSDLLLAASINSFWFSNVYLNNRALRKDLFELLKNNLNLYSSEFLSYYLNNQEKK